MTGLEELYRDPKRAVSGAAEPGWRSVLAAALALALAGCVGGTARRDAGPWIWSGAVTPSSAVVKARLPGGAGPAWLLVGRSADLSDATKLEPKSVSKVGVMAFELGGLSPATRYHYALARGDERPLEGTLQTHGEGPFSFTFALSACARTGSDSPVFHTIRRHQPLFFLHLGDLHYENVTRPVASAYRRAYERALTAPAQAALYRSTPVVYVWDDHDYGANNADADNPGRTVVRQVYQEVVPHYPLAAGEGNVPIYQAFSVGRVRFVVTDSRSERTASGRFGGRRETMLGREQKAWLENELVAAGRDHALVVWANTVPWIAEPSARGDDWGAYASERREIAELIAGDERVPPVFMVTGDAHMLAFDDGSHNTYGDGSPGFPVFHAAALDQRGSVKGGPYSHGTIPGGGHFGLVEIDDDGSTLRVSVSGRDADDRVLLAYSWTVP